MPRIITDRDYERDKAKFSVQLWDRRNWKKPHPNRTSTGDWRSVPNKAGGLAHLCCRI